MLESVEVVAVKVTNSSLPEADAELEALEKIRLAGRTTQSGEGHGEPEEPALGCRNVLRYIRKLKLLRGRVGFVMECASPPATPVPSIAHTTAATPHTPLTWVMLLAHLSGTLCASSELCVGMWHRCREPEIQGASYLK